MDFRTTACNKQQVNVYPQKIQKVVGPLPAGSPNASAATHPLLGIPRASGPLWVMYMIGESFGTQKLWKQVAEWGRRVPPVHITTKCRDDGGRCVPQHNKVNAVPGCCDFAVLVNNTWQLYYYCCNRASGRVLQLYMHAACLSLYVMKVSRSQCTGGIYEIHLLILILSVSVSR